MPATIRLPISMAIGSSEPREVGTVEIPLQVTPGDDGSVDITKGAARDILITALRELANAIEDDANLPDGDAGDGAPEGT